MASTRTPPPTWWPAGGSDPVADPVDRRRGADSLAELLDSLRWRLLPDWGDARYLEEYNASLDALRGPLGLKVDGRFNRDAPRPDRAADAAGSRVVKPTDHVLTARPSWSRVDVRDRRGHPVRHHAVAPARMPAARRGVRRAGPATPTVDRRPAPDGAALRARRARRRRDRRAGQRAVRTRAKRRDTERLLEAFTAQMINRIGTPDGTVEIEELEHARAFTSLPAGIAGTDRFLQRAEPGRRRKLGSPDTSAATVDPVNGARDRCAHSAEPAPSSFTPMSCMPSTSTTSSRPHRRVLDHQWDRRPITMAPTEPRVVDRPAIRHTFPADPMVAVQGAGRSLRHGNDGRSSPDGKLTCRWPTQVWRSSRAC